MDSSGLSLVPFGYLLACVSILLLVAFALYKWKASTHEAALIFQAVLTGAAIVVAGYWYVVERRGSPHADVSQTLTQAPVGSSAFAVEVAISIKNLGSTLLRVESADVRLQQVTPSALPVDELAQVAPDAWPEKFSSGTPMFSGGELQWPSRRWFVRTVKNEVEPGETDTIIVDFVVPCSVTRFRIATELTKPGNDRLTWKARTFGTNEICRQRRGK